MTDTTSPDLITKIDSIKPDDCSSIKQAPSMSSQIEPESLNGLNELTKLLDKDSSGLSFTATKPFKHNLRIMTKVMATANDHAYPTKIAKSGFSRTDLSVLRNLRKGGLI